MPRARALLVGLEGMSADIVGRLLKEEPNCEIVEIAERAELLEAIRAHKPTIVVVALRDSEMGPGLDDVFLQHPKVQVLAVTQGGRRACLFREPLEAALLGVLHES